MKTIEIKTEKKPAMLKSLEDHGDFFLMRIQGAIDTYALEQNRDKMDGVLDGYKLYEKQLLVDFCGVTRADTATLAILISRLAIRKKSGGKKLIFFGVLDTLRNLFEIAHLDELFAIRETEKEAIAALRMPG